jgi:CRP-like cAMP-binding protein
MTMADLRKLKDKAAELAAKGKVEKAAELFREIVRADPRDVASCQKLADVLRRGGEIAEAVDRYASVAERFARDGLLIKSIAICKTILELDPEHAHTQQLLADLYAKRSIAEAGRPPMRTMMGIPAVKLAEPPPAKDRVIELEPVADEEMEVERGVSLPLTPLVPPPQPELANGRDPFDHSDLPAELREASVEPARHPTALDLIVAAADEAVLAGVEEEFSVDVDVVDEEVLELLEVEPEPAPGAPAVEAVEAAAPRADARLPRVPIFSDLSPEAFVALTEGLSVTRLAAGQTVITEGEEGTAFYVVATGRLQVKKRDEKGDHVVLAHLGEGEFFGEMALLSGAPRNATVVAEEPSEVLVIQAEVLRTLAGRYPHLADSLRHFYRQRLLANALAVSPLFRPFGRGDRKAVMEKFRERTVRAGEVIVREGTAADGLYVVLEGAVDVTRRREATELLVGQLREGDLFGEMSCLRKTGATATVTVRRPGSLLRLQRADFDALVMTFPTVLELVSELSEERAQNLDAILSGSAVFTEDGLVLI